MLVTVEKRATSEWNQWRFRICDVKINLRSLGLRFV